MENTITKETIAHKCNICNKELYYLNTNNIVNDILDKKNFIYHKIKYICKECFY